MTINSWFTFSLTFERIGKHKKKILLFIRYFKIRMYLFILIHLASLPYISKNKYLTPFTSIFFLLKPIE